MVKAALIFAPLFLLAFSGAATFTPASKVVFAPAALGDGAPALALLAYLALILLGAAIAIAVLRRGYRREG